MAWALLDDNFPNHPKVLRAGPVAAYLFVCGLCYCRKYNTDGFIPSSAVKTLQVTTNPKRLVAALLDVCLWDAVDGGYLVHGYGEMYDDTAVKASQEERREKRRAAGKLGGKASWAKRSAEALASSIAEAETKHPAEALAEPLRDGVVPERSVVVPVPEGGVGETSPWETFAAAYPPARRKGGYRVQTLLVDALRRTTLACMLAALDNHKASAQWANEKHIPGMDVWLEEHRWTQQLDPPSLVGTTPRTAGNAAAMLRFVERHREN